MSSLTPRPAELQKHVEVYLRDATAIITQSLTACLKSVPFHEIYHTSLSADCVLKALATPDLKPRLGASRSVVVRIPLLVSTGQLSVAVVELRRFLELVCWTVYFSDHPIEWQSFEADSGGGFSQDTRKPISYAAHRELRHYVEYARELMGTEPSHLGLAAVDALKQVSHELNTGVHAGELALVPAGTPSVDKVSDKALRRFGGIQRRVFSNSCLLLAAYKRSRFDRLKAIERAHFDWLVGAKVRRLVRQGPFGLN